MTVNHIAVEMTDVYRCYIVYINRLACIHNATIYLGRFFIQKFYRIFEIYVCHHYTTEGSPRVKKALSVNLRNCQIETTRLDTR